ncbi:unnamed protein product [Sphagnum balticum]
MLYCSVTTIFNYQNHLCQNTPRRRSSHSDISSEEEALSSPTHLQLTCSASEEWVGFFSVRQQVQPSSERVGRAKAVEETSTRAKRQTPGAPRRRPDAEDDDGSWRRRQERASSRNGWTLSKPRGRLLAVPEPRRRQVRLQRTCFRASRFSEPLAVPLPFRRVQPWMDRRWTMDDTSNQRGWNVDGIWMILFRSVDGP